MTARQAAPGAAISLALGVCLAGALCLAADAPTTPSAPHVKCPDGMVCIPQAVYQHQIETESACLAALQDCRAKGPGKWGWCAGAGMSYGTMPVATEGGSWEWKPIAGPTATVLWGRRF